MIAIIAGTGSLPLAACHSLLSKQEPFFIISLFPEDNLHTLQSIVGDKAAIIVKEFYKPSLILETLKEHQAKKLLFIGKVDKRNLLKKLQFDWLFFKFSSQLLYKSDKAIMELLVNFLQEEHGIQVISQQHVLSSLLVPPGVLCGNLTTELKADIDMGLNLAQAISLHDIGQTVVVKDGMILAVEAIEGTDECIKRGVVLGKEKVVICKAARIDQNKKYDLPTLGPDSLKNILPDQVAALAWQSSQTFIAQKELFIARAHELGITLVSV